MSSSLSSGSPPGVVAPGGLKSVGQYLKVAAEHETRDVVVAYWARFFAVRRCLELDRSSEEGKGFIVGLLGWLERRKAELRDNEAITNEQVAEAHIENYVIKLFKWADLQERQGTSSGGGNKNVVRAYYTSSLLVDVLECFSSGGGGGGEESSSVGEEFERMRKYGRWRAAHIHSCLKNGTQPDPPPSSAAGTNDDDNQQQFHDDEGPGSSSGGGYDEAVGGPSTAAAAATAEVPTVWGGEEEDASSRPAGAATAGGVSLGVDVISRAQKYCKWAGSALNFDDVPTAVENLEKALSLLRRGVE